MEKRCFVLELDDMVAGGHEHGAEHKVSAEVLGGLTIDIGTPVGSVMYLAEDSQLVAVAVRDIFAIVRTFLFLGFQRYRGRGVSPKR